MNTKQILQCFYYILINHGEGNGNPLQCSCLGNPMDRGAWWATVHGVAKSQTHWATNTPINQHYNFIYLQHTFYFCTTLEPYYAIPGIHSSKNWKSFKQIFLKNLTLFSIKMLPLSFPTHSFPQFKTLIFSSGGFPLGKESDMSKPHWELKFCRGYKYFLNRRCSLE